MEQRIHGKNVVTFALLNSDCFDIALFVRSLRLVLLLQKLLAIKVVCIQARLTVVVLERQQAVLVHNFFH